MSECKLYVNGQIYGGWTDVTIRQSMTSVAGAFSIGLTERWAGQTEVWAIPAGAQCRVDVAGQTVITGYVDSVQVSHAAAQHSIVVSGRDATCDLVDCSAENGTYLQQPFLSICRTLVASYGIEVVDQAGVNYTVKRFVVQTGESVFQALERAARLAGVLLTSDGLGRLVLTQAGGAGRATTALVTGPEGNVLSANFTHDASQLYSVIRVKSQCTASGLNQFDLSVASPEAELPRTVGSASTPGVDRYRPLTLVAETQALADRCQQRAAWEAGMLHDLCKEMPKAQMEIWMRQLFPQHLDEPAAIWHGYLGSVFAGRLYGCQDKRVRCAIYHHVKGDCTQPYAMITYCADKLEPGRGYDSSEQIALCMRSLRRGFMRVKAEQSEYLKKEKNGQ